MRIKASFAISLFILVLIIHVFAVGCASGDTKVRAYADNFFANLNKEIDAWDSFNSAYTNADFETEYGISSFQKTLPNHLWTFNNLLNSYQSTCPNTAPQDLKDAVNLAKDATTKIIAGITTIDNAITNLSTSQLDSGEKQLNDGVTLLNQASTKYNSFADNINAKSSSGGMNIGLGILIGTGILWLLSLLVVNPLASHLTKRKLALEYANLPQDENVISQKVNSTYNRTYILVALTVLGIAGFLMGLIAGWYFIGISWRPRDWPGLIAFIGFSFLGSYIHG